MKYILAKSNRRLLRQFAWSNTLLGFDFDGTLAPIVMVPEEARMRSSTQNLLESLARLYPCVVISGRTQNDMRKRLRGIALKGVIGSHGIEPLQVNKRPSAQVNAWRAFLAHELEHFRGVIVEDKVYSLAVHYRRSREKKRALAAILQTAAKLEDVKLIPGKQVLNFLPHDAPHKGMALESERNRLGCDTAIYVGDDDTDEDVFMMDEPGRLLTIRVGHKKTSYASYYLRRQGEIDTLIGLLISLRQKKM